MVILSYLVKVYNLKEIAMKNMFYYMDSKNMEQSAK